MRLAVTVVALGLCISARAEAEEPIWFWHSTCGGPMMTLEVRLDDETVYESSIPLCHAARSSLHSQGQRARIRFTLDPTRPIVCRGYRDGDVTTDAGQRLDAHIWQAGADPDGLILGASFADREGIYMNTVHPANPARRTESTIAEELDVMTYPTRTKPVREDP